MKLSIRLSIIITTVVLVLFSASLFVSYNLQVQFMKDVEETNAVNALVSNCANVKKSVELQGVDYNSQVESSVVQFVYADFSKLIKDKDSYYSISTSEYFYGYTPIDPREYFDEEDFSTSDTAFKRLSNGIFVAHKFTVLSDIEFTAYLYQDTGDMNAQTSNLLLFIIMVSAISLSILILVINLVIRKTLKPIEVLTVSAEKISAGNYSLRTNIKGKDEVATLSKAFDDMAMSIEEKVEFLKEEVEKRELFVAALSHEIKTPITSIIGYTDSLKIMPLNESQKIDCINKIATAGSYLDKINLKIMELVGLSEISEIEKKLFDVADLCHNISDLGVIVRSNCKEIYGDETLIHSLIFNLCSNALRYSPDVSVYIDKENNHYTITVTDKGKGIEKEKIPLLTETFYRVDKARGKKDGGLGLGLSICDRICKLHSGSLIIKSEVGKGTSITAKLQKDYISHID